MNEPFAMVVSPGQVYLAPVGTTFPAVDAVPATPWGLLGTYGNRNHSETGIKIVHEKKMTEHFVSGSTGAQKATVQQERLTVAGELEDLTVEQYTKLLNGVAVQDIAELAGVAGYRQVNLRQGFDPAEFAVLIRLDSPYGQGMKAQYQIPRVYQSANPSPALSKAGPAMLQFEFSALEDLSATSADERFGKFIAQDAFPL